MDISSCEVTMDVSSCVVIMDASAVAHERVHSRFHIYPPFGTSPGIDTR